MAGRIFDRIAGAGSRSWWRAAAALYVALLAAAPAQGADPLEVLGPSGKRTVTLVPQADGSHKGNLKLVVRNTTDKSGRLKVRYFPEGEGRAITLLRSSKGPVTLADVTANSLPTVRAGAVQQLDLRFTVPKGEPPSSVDGRISIDLRQEKGTARVAVVEIAGSANAFAGITFQPSRLNIQSVRWNPLDNGPEKTATVQLRGADVESLFKTGVQSPAPSLLLRHGSNEIRVKVEKIERDAAGSAQAMVRASGDLDPGKYEGELRLSAAADSPALPVTVKVQDAFIWAVLAVLLGAVVGGLLFLLSGLNRRKVILRAHLKGALERFRDEYDELTEYDKSSKTRKRQSPLWSLEDLLGNRDNWFKTKWSALPELDGVQGVWSNITWARNDEDLDAETGRVQLILTRLRRWLQLAPKVKALRKVTETEPRSHTELPWRDTNTKRDTQRLLRWIRETEPQDDKALREVILRVERQARWHDSLAQAWDLRTRVRKDMDDRKGAYTQPERDWLARIELGRLDEGAAPEKGRSAEQQLECEEQLDNWSDILKSIYKGDRAAEGPPPKPRQKVIEETSPDQAFREQAAETPSLAVLRDEDRPGVAASLRGLFWRDLVWTAAIALVTAVAYILPFYDDTWGNWTDYGTAFTAGFLGRIGIGWAVLPLFKSLRLRVERGKDQEEVADEGKGQAGNGEPERETRRKEQPPTQAPASPAPQPDAIQPPG